MTLLESPRVVGTFAVLVLVAGLASLANIVRQEDPTITNGIGVIVTGFPGASAERVEALVTEKIEAELIELPEIATLSSTSRNGASVVVVQIDENVQGKDVEPIFSKVRDRLDDAQAEFPQGAGTPELDTNRFGAYTYILGLRWTSSSSVRPGLMLRWAEELQDRLRGLPGTDHAKIFGQPEEEIRVEIDPAALEAAGLTAGQVAGAIAGADVKGSAGVLRGSSVEAPIELRGEIDGLDRVRRVPLGPDVLQVGDVAEVRRELRAPRSVDAFVDEKAALVVAAQIAPGVRFDKWRVRADEVLNDFEAGLPGGLELTKIFDQTAYTEARLASLVQNLLVGLALVVAVLFLTLGWRAALSVTLTLPLVSSACLAVLGWMGVPIHQMSVTGLIVALGLLVDAAIVVVDAIRQRIIDGQDRRRALRESLGRLWLPLLASTLTTVFAFMPILLLPGRVGEFVGTIGLSVIVALIASYVMALSVVPVVASRFMRPPSQEPRLFEVGLRLPALGRWFRRSLDWSLAHPVLSLALVTIVPVAGVLGSSTLARQFFPPADRDQFHIQLRMPPATPLARTREAAQAVDAILREEEAVERTSWFIGQSAPPAYYNLRQNQDGNPSFAQALVEVGSVADVQAILPSLQRRIDREVPQAQVLLLELLQGPPVDAPIEVRIYGPDLEILRGLGDELRARMAKVPSVTHTLATLRGGAPKLWLEADEEEARLAGLRLAEVTAQIGARMEGVTGGSLLEGPEEVPVRVVMSDRDRSSMGSVGALGLLGPGGGAPLPLDGLASMSLQSSWAAIPHRNGQRVDIVRAWTHAGVFPDTAFVAFQDVLEREPIELPPGYRIEIGGDAEKRGDAMGDLFALVPVLVVLMFACVALSLDSFRLGGIVFVVAGQSMGLGLLSATIGRHPLGFQAMIGLIGLVGVAINAAIIICSALREDAKAAVGDPTAIADVVQFETSRHIVSTTITTFGGFLPLILSPGGFWPPFATGIAGGVLLSSLLSFYFVPAAFLLVARWRTASASALVEVTA
ncbi:MAG: efflux RND transporter permease subunit [Myxococcota bacterium]